MLVGPADIRFELWFDDQKLSRDESIKVEWTPAQAPNTVELPADPSTPIRTAQMAGPGFNNANGKGQGPSSSAVIGKATAGVNIEEKKTRGMSGIFSRARGGRWSLRGS